MHICVMYVNMCISRLFAYFRNTDGEGGIVDTQACLIDGHNYVLFPRSGEQNAFVLNKVSP